MKAWKRLLALLLCLVLCLGALPGTVGAEEETEGNVGLDVITPDYAEELNKAIWTPSEDVEGDVNSPDLRIRYASIILTKSNITLAKKHPSGVVDNAFAYNNIVDTSEGKPASRSNYVNAPGGTVYLDIDLLKCLLDLEEHFGKITVSEIAGASHSKNSLHYKGVAMDVTYVGTSVSVQKGKEIYNYLVSKGYRLRTALNASTYGVYEDSSHYHIALNKSGSSSNYTLDVNGWLDGADWGTLSNYGTFDITVAGVTYSNQNDFYGEYPSGTTYTITNIQSTGIHTYHGVHSGFLSGTIGSSNVVVSLNFRTNDTIGDKFYAYIKAKDSQSVLFNQEDNNVVGAPPTDDLGALWYFELVDNSKNIYKIISAKNGWALDVYGGDSTPGTDVKTYPYGSGDPAEQWVIHEENGYVLLGALCTPCVLDAGGAVNGATANAYMNNELLNDWQWLKIEKTNPDIYSISFNPESLTMMPGENANITVKFTIANAKNYKLTNSNGDTCEVTIGSEEIDENDRSKYVVTYNVEAKSVGTSTLTFYLMDSNQNVLQTETVTVTVVPSTLTVSFNPNGGNVSPTSKTVAVGSKYGDLPTPERYNYTFAGWYTQSNGGTKVTSDTVVTSSTNHTLYAHWNELPCDASFSPSSLSLKPGESAEATLTFSGPNVSTLSLGSSNESVFTSTTLDAANNGGVCTYKLKIEAKGGGTANLILRLFDANNNVLLTKEMPVTVSSNVTSVNLNKSQLWLFLNHVQYGQEKLTATVKPDDAPNKNVTWRSTNPELVHVSSDGTVTAIEIGAENVIATSEDGGKEGACSVMVSQQIFSSKTLAVGESTYLMIVSNWVLKNYFDYSSSDPNVVSLETESYEKLNENGKTSRICKITAKSPGTTVITATPQHDKSKQLSFTVTVISNAQYTITYNANGGTGAPAAQTKTHGIPLTLSTTKPTRSGYTFLGWAAGSQYQRTVDYQPGGDFPVDQDTVLYAVWELNSCEEVIAKLTSWGNNGGTVHVGFNGSYYKVAIDAGDRVKITNLDVGSFFWFLIDDANEVAEAARVYDISYDAKGGSGAPNSQFKLHGTALTLSTMQPTRSGYTFLGWAESRSATAAQYQPGGQFTKESDTTLYAVWRANTYTVYFDPEGGTVSIENILVTYDDTYGELPTPQKAGYIFDGWYLFVNDDWKEITSDTIVDRTQNHVLYAFWRALPGAGAPNPSASITSFTRSGSKATMKVKLSGVDADQVRVLLSAVDNSGRCLGVKSGTLTATGEAGVYSAGVALPDGAAAYYKAFVVGAGSAPLAEAARLDA